jgi:ribonuclease E
VQRNKNSQLRLRALADIAALRDPDAFDTAIDIIGGWPREERREATKIMLRALVERRIGRRDQATAWIWRLAGYTREVHEEYAVQRWPETKRLLGLLVNSSGGAHARNARRLIHAARKQDRRLAAALLAAALAHTPEAEEALRGARTRMARKPPALARELLRNFPKRRARNNRRRRNKGAAKGPGADAGGVATGAGGADGAAKTVDTKTADSQETSGGGDSQNGTRDARAAKNGAAPRASSNRRRGGGGAGKRAKKSQTPSDAVLDEALTGKAATSGSANGSGLAPAEEGKLDRNVAEALEHAEE